MPEETTVVGRDPKGQFTSGSEVAKKAGASGGKAAQESGRAHRLTSVERAAGGKNSRRRPKNSSK